MRQPFPRGGPDESITTGHRAPRKVSSMRLPASEIMVLRLLWGGLASRVGLGSNYNGMVASCQNAAGKVVSTEPASGFQSGERKVTDTLEPGAIFNREDSSWSYMHVKSTRVVYHGYVCRCSGPCACEVDLSAVERNACWSNQESKAVQEAYIACKRMVDAGNGHLVGVLYRMYSGEMPFVRYGQFQILEDLVPVAPDTTLVYKRTAEMRKLAPTSEWEALKDMVDRKSGDSKEQDKRRDAVVQNIKAECQRILIRASSAYLEAKRRG